ncbi:hypothetical protein CEXT_513371 [Caerostris extrusa]|uniref:Uncharacterized protein n=1 Tax=Caerostris extrusa TaxID=172846 RepID=A0AAV4N395_CAEEX|nr:hypothetical protein CEXT_513371 [Caerostris extrusa]
MYYLTKKLNQTGGIKVLIKMHLVLGCTFHFGAFVPIRRLSRPWKEGEDSESPINHALRAVVDDGGAFSCQEEFWHNL